MKLDATLSSILVMKTMYPESSTPCYHLKPTEDILKKSKNQQWIIIKNKSKVIYLIPTCVNMYKYCAFLFLYLLV